MKKIFIGLCFLGGITQWLNGQNVFPTEKNSNVIIDGGNLTIIRPADTRWHGGLYYRNAPTSGLAASIGVLSNNGEYERIYLGINNAPWAHPQGIHLLKNGNLGIGTLTPLAKLHVQNGPNSDAAVLATSTENNRLIVRSEVTTPVNVATFKILHEFGDNRNNGYIAFHRGDNRFRGFLSFGANGTESMRIDNNGKVGIGTSAPKSKLHVVGDAHFAPENALGGIHLRYTDGGIKVASADDDISYIDFKGIDNLTKDYMGRIFHQDGYGFIFLNTNNAGQLQFLSFRNDGYVGIGTRNPDEKLTVDGNIHTKEIKVDLQMPPADYVFQKYYTGNSGLKSDYKFPTLQEVEKFAKENHHLPGIPSAEEIQQNGVLLGEMNNLLLQKIEELTLYTIEQEKEIENLKTEIQQIKQLLLLQNNQFTLKN